MDEDMHSLYLKQFIREITERNRNPRNLEALELLDDLSTNPVIKLGENETLYRSRIIRDENGINKAAGFYGFDASGSFVPPKKQTKDMRANYRYIPYLYCSNHPYLALVEVRPRLGASVSIATIVVKEELTLLDFTNANKPSKMSDAKKNLFSDLSYLFSKPITDEDDILDYIPTQFIAEYAKNLGYDGIVYRSSLVPEINSAGINWFNIVVFNYSKCEPKKSNVIQIVHDYLEGVQTDTDVDRLQLAPKEVSQAEQIDPPVAD